MKKGSFLAVAVALMMAASSCSNKAQLEQRILELENQRDSISHVAQQTQQEHDQLFSYVSGIEASLDSIATAEHLIMMGKGEDGRTLTRLELKEYIKNFGSLLQRQREYINMLEDSLRNNTGSASHLLTMVSTLRQQLDAKEKEVAKLRKDLQNERKSLESLRESLGAMEETNKLLDEQNQYLEQALVQQNEAINIGYVLCGTKKELEAAGVLKGGGFLRKKKVDYSSFNTDAFSQVDIRTFNHYAINGKKAKLITAAPENAYTLTRTDDRTWKLTINSPADFWSVSNYLIIQTD